jgi:adenine-specific DNA-methyltransferase
MSYTKSKGQYFTKNVFLKESVYKIILNNPSKILEPSCGKGHLIEHVLQNNENVCFDMYEIDDKLDILKTINKDDIKFVDFLKEKITERYDTVIGNPPFVKTKTGNLFLKFIQKCYNLLNNNGELIFIVPSDFIKQTSSSKIINEMMNNGTFTHIIHPHDETLFDNANVDVIVFRYCKNKELNNTIRLNDEDKFLINTNGILTFSDSQSHNLTMFSDFFDIYVGMVTGKECVYKNETFGNIDVLNGKDKLDKYILIKSFPTKNESLNEYMLSNKKELIERKIRTFNENNWFEWGALRNYTTIQNNIGKKCIYVNNITRSKDVCFEGTVQLFGGGLIIMIPKKEIDIDNIVTFINSDSFKSNYMYSGRFKIGHKQLCNCLFHLPNIS